MARVLTNGWELGHTGNNTSGTVIDADAQFRSASSTLDTATPGRAAVGKYLRAGVSSNTALGAYAASNIPATGEFYLRFAFRYNDDASPINKNSILTWVDAEGDEVGSLRLVGTSLSVFSGVAEVASAAAVISLETWHLIEIHWLTNNTTGRAEVKVDSALEIDFTGNTDQASQGDVTQLRFGGVQKAGDWTGGGPLNYDDIAVDGAGFLGDGHVLLLRPNGNGNTSQLTGSDGNQINNFQLVDEVPVNTADFVEGSVDGLKDTYSLEDTSSVNIPNGATVNHVDVVAIARTLDVGTGALKGVVRTGATDFASSQAVLGSDFTVHRFAFPVNPNTSSAWTLGELDAAEAGVEIDTVV